MACTHHWRIEPPEGPLSEGVCLLCGERRFFRNSEKEWSPAKRSIKAHTMYCSSETTETTTHD